VAYGIARTVAPLPKPLLPGLEASCCHRGSRDSIVLYRRREDLDHYKKGLRLAGLPE